MRTAAAARNSSMADRDKREIAEISIVDKISRFSTISSMPLWWLELIEIDAECRQLSNLNPV